MSSSQALRNLRDESEEEEIDQLPIRRFLQQSKGKKPSSSHSKTSHGFSPPKKSRKKTADNAYGPSKATSFQVSVLLSLLRPSMTGFNVRMPSSDNRPQHHPANHQTWFLEHFSVGLIPQVLSFYTSVYTLYGVAPNQVHPNSI